MVSEVPRCQTVKTAAHHDAQLIGDSLSHVQLMEFIVQECRQAAIELPCVTGHTFAVNRIVISLVLCANIRAILSNVAFWHIQFLWPSNLQG